MIFIYNWNFIFADWNQFSKVYVHHITKKSLFYIAILYTFVRGLYLPNKKGFNIGYLLPINFVFITTLSFILDTVKTWCYISSYFKKINFLKQSF